MREQETERHDDSAREVACAASSAYVVTLHGSGPGAVRDLSGMPLVIGRAAEPARADLCFDDPRMSRVHARIAHGAGGWRIEDLGSRNGGFIDGAVLAPGGTAALGDGAILRIGDTLLTLRAQRPPPPIDSEREAFPGASPPAAEVRRRLALVAGGSGHVLILGETGTGKERVARRIGRTSPPRPFVPQNCAELGRELARSELFGHARGAFSGAATRREGLVDAAEDGVLFLDELGELPLDVQGELLRFLEDGSYRPVGAAELRHSRARVVAATNVDLDAAVRAGTFRRDLLARLRATNAPLALPPLRERREDVLGWARLFLNEACPTELPPHLWTAGAAECLVLYPWPENLRELRGVMRGLVEAAPAWPIDTGALPARLRAHRAALRGGGGAAQPERRDLRQGGAAPPAAEPTREAIERALTDAAGRMRAASGLLGIERRKLYRMCEKLDIDIDNYRSGGRR